MRHGTAAICQGCDGLCVSVAEQEKKEADARRRARPLRVELGAIFSYPFTDTLAYVVFAFVVFVFGFAASIAGFGGPVGVLFSQGLLYAYAFTALNRVSSGQMKGFMPEISDITDLVAPFRVGIAALIVSSAPLFILLFLFPAVSMMGSSSSRATSPPAMVEAVPATPEATPGPYLGDEEEGVSEPELSEAEARALRQSMEAQAELSSAPPIWILPALGLALLWKIVYSPVALIAGGISRSFVSTLNPVTGILAIRRMGSVYWEAMVVYTVLAIGEVVVSLALGWIPVAGRFVTSFVQGYVYLVIGCLLGLAVYKKAPELGLD